MPGRVSSSSRIFFPATWSRHRPARASRPAGSAARRARGPAANWPAHPPGRTGRCRAWACNGRKNCPSGKSCQPVGGVHREGGLPDPGHPGRRRGSHHPAVGGDASQGLRQPGKLSLAAGEAAISRGSSRLPPPRSRRPRSRAASISVACTRPRAAATNRSRAGSSRPSAPPAAARCPCGRWVDGAFQVTDRPLAHPCGLGELFLGQPASSLTGAAARRTSARPVLPQAHRPLARCPPPPARRQPHPGSGAGTAFRPPATESSASPVRGYVW